MGRFSYTTGSRWPLLGGFAFFVAAGVAMVVTTLVRPDGPPLLFVAIWIGALGWSVYWLLWRVSYRLEVDGERLRWRTPLRAGEILLSDVQGIRTGWFGGMAVIEVRDHEDVMSLSRTGISEFASAVAGDRDIPVDTWVPWGERFADTVRNAFRRER
jgi:hypothetical protein